MGGNAILAFVETLLEVVQNVKDAFLTFKIITVDKNLCEFVIMCNFNLCKVQEEKRALHLSVRTWKAKAHLPLFGFVLLSSLFFRNETEVVGSDL